MVCRAREVALDIYRTLVNGHPFFIYNGIIILFLFFLSPLPAKYFLGLALGARWCGNGCAGDDETNGMGREGSRPMSKRWL
ncbi:hypothetical protein DFAR_630052 [Desulfarculales bacterium]